MPDNGNLLRIALSVINSQNSKSNIRGKTIYPLYIQLRTERGCVLRCSYVVAVNSRCVLITCEQFAETWRYSLPIKVCVAI